MSGPGLQVARQQVRGVGLHQQAVERDFAHQFAQVLAPAFVADPAGDADRQAQFQVVTQLAPVTGEAMSDAACEPRQVVLENGDKSVVTIALVAERQPSRAKSSIDRDTPSVMA
mgnify:CR=1 FL=1